MLLSGFGLGCSSRTRLGNSDAAIVRDAYFCEKLSNAREVDRVMPLCRGVVIEKFGKLFKFLNREGFGNPPTVFESHQRQLVVRSDPFYNAPNTLTRNPTNGSWWIVSDPFYNATQTRACNPTNGSWWIVQILPKGSEVSTHCRGWDYF